MQQPSLILASLVLGTVAWVPLPAWAGFSLGAGVEQYRWQETFPSGAAADREQGARYALFLRDELPLDQRLSVVLRSKLYSGHPGYAGQTQVGVPISAATDSLGLDNALLGVFHATLLHRPVDYSAGVGYDLWRRDIRNPAGGDQVEDWAVTYARAGIELFEHRHRGWHGGADLTYVLHVSENLHLTELGGDANPGLSPGGALGYGLNAGYRFDRHWDLAGYWRHRSFSRSPAVQASFSGTPATVYQPKSVNDLYGVALAYRF